MFDDASRLRALRDYRILDTPAEESFEQVTALASKVLGTPIALVTLIDEQRQWFKSRVGLALSETPREQSFCDHAVRQDRPLIVADATKDVRFAHNPLVVGAPNIRFYCGVPIRSSEGHGLGTLCVIDDHARTISDRDLSLLESLAKLVELEVESRSRVLLLQDALREHVQDQARRDLLAAMVVHDLRSPLTSLMMLASVIRPADDSSRELLDDALREAERMARMLADMLDLSLEHVAGLGLRRRSFVLQEFLRRVELRTQRLAAARGHRVTFDLPSRPITISADPDLIDRVMSNLLENAMHHGSRNQTITVTLRAGAAGGSRIEVRDEGEPIATEMREKIFHPFEQLPRALGGTHRGHGLGLAFCKLAIEAHQGTIGVVPNGTLGNCFFFELPASVVA